MDRKIHTVFLIPDVIYPSYVCQYLLLLAFVRRHRVYHIIFYLGKDRPQP